MSDSPNLDSKQLHSGAYVLRYERKPMSRITRLIEMMELAPQTSLVDFACGNAMLLSAVHGRIGHYTGVDFSEDFIASAHTRARSIGADYCEFHCQDIVEFCASNEGRFDVATALDFSEHILDNEFLQIFAAIRNSLKPGGRLYLHTPNLDFILERMRDSGFILKQRPEHVAVRNVTQNIALLERAGFSCDRIEARTIGHYNLLAALHPLRHLPWIGRYFEARIFIECIR